MVLCNKKTRELIHCFNFFPFAYVVKIPTCKMRLIQVLLFFLFPQEPSAKLSRAGWVLRTLILCQCPHLIRDRKYHSDPTRQLRTFRRCLVGSEMVEFLMQQGGPQVRIHSRSLAMGMWQALMEEGVISHGEGNFRQCQSINSFFFPFGPVQSNFTIS